jgi:hypothetical protein
MRLNLCLNCGEVLPRGNFCDSACALGFYAELTDAEIKKLWRELRHSLQRLPKATCLRWKAGRKAINRNRRPSRPTPRMTRKEQYENNQEETTT